MITLNPTDAVYAVLSFFILPSLTDFFAARQAPGAVKILIVSIISIGSGLAIVLLEGNFSGGELSKTILIIITSGVGSYKFFMKDFSSIFNNIGPQLGAPKASVQTDNQPPRESLIQ